MVRKVLLKFSSVLYRAHVFINKHVKPKTSFKPYILKNLPSQSNIKIVHVIGNFWVGGSTQLVVDLIERTSHKFSHEVVVLSQPDPLPYQPVSLYTFTISQMTDLYKYLLKGRPAIVHIHYWVGYNERYECIALWYQTIFKICNDLKIKVIQNINAPTTPYHCSSVFHNVFVSNYVEKEFNDDKSVNASVIHPGSDFSHFTNSDINALPSSSIGMVYRLGQDKLNEKSIEVFISAVKRKPDLMCYIIGEGYYLDYYKKRVRQERLKRNFIFTGAVSYKSLPDYYRKFGVFVAPVHTESFGQVTPFAMSMGQCVAGYDIGALSEILGSKDTLVEYGDVEGLAKLIVDLVNRPENLRQIGYNNRERAHKYFSVENMVNQYEKLYDSFV